MLSFHAHVSFLFDDICDHRKRDNGRSSGREFSKQVWEDELDRSRSGVNHALRITFAIAQPTSTSADTTFQSYVTGKWLLSIKTTTGRTMKVLCFERALARFASC